MLLCFPHSQALHAPPARPWRPALPCHERANRGRGGRTAWAWGRAGGRVACASCRPPFPPPEGGWGVGVGVPTQNEGVCATPALLAALLTRDGLVLAVLLAGGLACLEFSPKHHSLTHSLPLPPPPHTPTHIMHRRAKGARAAGCVWPATRWRSPTNACPASKSHVCVWVVGGWVCLGGGGGNRGAGNYP